MNKSINELTVTCPSCHSRIRFSKLPLLREIIVCSECDETLEVVDLRPLKVDWSLLDDEYSWADADDDEYDDRFDRYNLYD